jgi:oligopeptide transport system ATP-binding protein
MEAEVLLKVTNLSKFYPVKKGIFQRIVAHLKAVNDVSFDLKTGECLGLVGESGCGKSTLGRNIMRLEEPTSGEVNFKGQNMVALTEKDLRPKRHLFQMIFQDPFSSLNPKMTVYRLLAEPIENFNPQLKKEEIREKVIKLMGDVGLRSEYAGRYAHEFSGGQRQRISIGRALATNPQLIVCDEPVSALDVSIQAQIINLLMDLQEKYNFSYIFISHDLHVVRHISNRIAVMYLGKIVEIGPAEEIFTHPLHPYTRALLSSVPVPRVGGERKRMILCGDVPSPIDPPAGCSFHPRCPYACERCQWGIPPLEEFNGRHQAACIRIKEIFP